MANIEVAFNPLFVSAGARYRVVSALWYLVRHFAVRFCQHRMVDVIAERFLNIAKIRFMAVGRSLDASGFLNGDC